jgi:hypothetical protein
MLETAADVIQMTLSNAAHRAAAARRTLDNIPANHWGDEIKEAALAIHRATDDFDGAVLRAMGRYEVAKAKQVLAQWEGKL